MTDNKPDMTALIQAVADTPRRDNAAYHKAMAQARQAFEEAERTLGGPVRMRSKAKLKRNGKYVVKWIFERGD